MGIFDSVDWIRVGLNAGLFITTLIAGLILSRVAVSILSRLAAHTESTLYESIRRHCTGPLRLIVLLFIYGVAWLVIRATGVIEDHLVDRFRVDVKDNLKARRIRTQFTVFRR